MLFEPYGQLMRIDMKRNYAFIQFKTVEEAALAREKTNGGKLDQSVLTVEFVARQRRHDDGVGYRNDRRRDDRGGYRGQSGYRGRDNGNDRYDDRRRDRGVGGSRSENEGRSYGGYDDRRGRYDDGPMRDRRVREPSPYQGGFRPRSRSRSRSPLGGHRYRSSRSPPPVHRGSTYDRRSGDRYDDYRGGVRGPSPPPTDYRGRGPSPSRRAPSPASARVRGLSPRGDRDSRGYRY